MGEFLDYKSPQSTSPRGYRGFLISSFAFGILAIFLACMGIFERIGFCMGMITAPISALGGLVFGCVCFRKEKPWLVWLAILLNIAAMLMVFLAMDWMSAANPMP
jgi:hypothetical protein